MTSFTGYKGPFTYDVSHKGGEGESVNIYFYSGKGGTALTNFRFFLTRGDGVEAYSDLSDKGEGGYAYSDLSGYV